MLEYSNSIDEYDERDTRAIEFLLKYIPQDKSGRILTVITDVIGSGQSSRLIRVIETIKKKTPLIPITAVSTIRTSLKGADIIQNSYS